MPTLQVNLGERSYPIRIGHGTLTGLGQAYQEMNLGRAAAIVTNPTVAELYLDVVNGSLRDSGIVTTVVTIPDGEAYKTLETADGVYGDLITAGLDRGASVVSLGGGVVGDTAGFVAATYLRGVPFVQIPTTLEAQVDASVGGKTGVDHPLGKNMIGAFHQPRMVYIDTDTLRSLPRREVVAGLAEVIKHALIRDADLFAFLEARLEEIIELGIEPNDLDWLISENCRIKAEVVEVDETEDSGTREVLNYGHTAGHAIEALTDYGRYRHGEAVCLGMLAAGKIALDRSFWTQVDFDRQNALLKRLGIPRGAAALEPAALVEQMGRDKKVRDGVIRFVLAEGIGQAASCDSVTRGEIDAGIAYMQECSS